MHQPPFFSSASESFYSTRICQKSPSHSSKSGVFFTPPFPSLPRVPSSERRCINRKGGGVKKNSEKNFSCFRTKMFLALHPFPSLPRVSSSERRRIFRKGGGIFPFSESPTNMDPFLSLPRACHWFRIIMNQANLMKKFFGVIIVYYCVQSFARALSFPSFPRAPSFPGGPTFPSSEFSESSKFSESFEFSESPKFSERSGHECRFQNIWEGLPNDSEKVRAVSECIKSLSKLLVNFFL